MCGNMVMNPFHSCHDVLLQIRSLIYMRGHLLAGVTFFYSDDHKKDISLSIKRIEYSN